MVLTALNYSILIGFSLNDSIKIFHKLKLMTLFILPMFPTQMKFYNCTGEPEIYHL